MIFLRTKNEEGDVEPYCPKCEFSTMNAGAWARINEEGAAHGINAGIIENKCTRCGEQLVPATKEAYQVLIQNNRMTICRGCNRAWSHLVTVEKILISENKDQSCDICECKIFP